MILWTGDNADHDQARQSRHNQTLNTHEITEGLLKYFPNAKIYPMFGILFLRKNFSHKKIL